VSRNAVAHLELSHAGRRSDVARLEDQ